LPKIVRCHLWTAPYASASIVFIRLLDREYCYIFVWDIIANDFYIIAGYSLPGCDLQ